MENTRPRNNRQNHNPLKMELQLEYISKPAYTKAVEFKEDGSNWKEVIDLVRLNGGEADLIYLTKDGNPAGPNKITEYRGVILTVGPGQAVAVPRGTFILLNHQPMFPMLKKDFLEMNLTMQDINEISNGQHTFKQLYRELERFEPTLEQCIVADKFSLSKEKPEVAEFIRHMSTHHVDNMLKTYYVLHGRVYVD